MPDEKQVIEKPQKIEPPMMSRFIVFSIVLFVALIVTGSAVFMLSMRQIIRVNKESELPQLLEIKRLRLETSVENEVSFVLMVADSPLIRRFFADPTDPELQSLAFQEFDAYRSAFSVDSIFWINNYDRLFYFNDDDPYVLNPVLPENYWYLVTLYVTEGYYFNINHNPDLDLINLWINAPVIDDDGTPLGMVGTSIDLTTFMNIIYEDYDGTADIFLFNSSGEITAAMDVGLVVEKKDITDELRSIVETNVLYRARQLEPGETQTIEFSDGKFAINDIPLLGWYSIAVFYYSWADYDSAMTIFFILTVIVIAMVLVIFNIFISRLLKPMRLSMEEAEAANKAKSAFLSTMSHEIRTPLNAILGVTEIQLQKEALDDGVREGLDKVYASGDMLLSIINDILDLSKIESGKLELLPGFYEVASLINDTVQLNIMRIGSKPIEFYLAVDENVPSGLIGDELRIKQVLNNLLSNAFKYTAKGAVRMTVSSEAIEGEKDRVVLVVSVSDTGQGMTKGQVDKLFDAYARFNMDANRSTEGTGLGMSITRNLVHMMDGVIQIESEKGKGSVFTVRIPQDVMGYEVLGKEIAENLRMFRTSGVANLRRAQVTYEPMPYGSVLIVDDVETNLYVAEGLMGPYGLKIDTADSGIEAIYKIKNDNVYDIIFMDHMMPGMDGIEATKIIRETGYDKPVVALTANAVAGQADVFLKSGFDDFISKPIDIRQLNALLNRWIRDKQAPEVIEEARAQVRAGKESSDETTATEGDGVDGTAAGAWEHPELNARFVDVFLRDAHRSITVLDALMEKGAPYSDEDIRSYVIQTHGVKGALANFGNNELSAIALKLEILGRNNDVAALEAQTPAFLKSLKAFVEELTPDVVPDDSSESADDKEYLKEMFRKIVVACEQFEESPVEDVLAELRERKWSRKVVELLDRIDEQLLHSEFDEIIDEIGEYL